MSVFGVAIVIVGLLVSVGLHELGHMFPAKKFGVPVPVFSLGFGPKIVEKKWGQTLYRLSVIPLGGYVRISGMFAPAPAGTKVVNRRGNMTLAQEARLASAEELPAGLESRAFYRLSAPRKVLVMFAGPVMNLVLAVVLFTVALVGIGVPVPSTTLGSVAAQIQTSSGMVQGPAADAGIEVGDTVVAIGDVPVAQWSDVVEVMGESQGQPVSVIFEREGVRRSVTLQPVFTAEGRWVSGIGAGVEYQGAGVGEVWRLTWQTLRGTAAMVLRLPVAVWDVARSVVLGQPRDASGLMSIVGIGRIASEVTSGEVSALGASASGGVDVRSAAGTLLMMLGSLNIALFVFNLLPVPPLDGGHIVGALYEGARRSFARWRGMPDPGPADTARLVPLTYVMGGVLLLLTLVLVVADFVALVWLVSQ